VLPGGETVELDAELEEIGPGFAVASVVKDAGDDPDVTNGAVIKARVELSSREEGDIRFYGGEGIGTVTLPGLGLEVGGPAINPVPRLMMEQAVRRLLPEGAVDITVSIPGGESLALRTFNSRVGVEGGLSIIGTSGVVRPFSNEAFAEALMREIEVAAATGCERLVMNSGAKSEKSVRSLYPQLPQQAFVHYGNAIGEALQGACRSGIKRVSIGLMIGKAVKLAEGHLDTHSHKVSLNREFLASLASSVGCSESAFGKIMGMDMARDLWNTIVPVDADLFFPELLRRCLKVCSGIYGGDIEMMIIDDNGVVKYRI
ncbi:MAG: cobalt-precorrin-5B (C(1))-methyltransferase CbiD, partial [Duncaniella sp.]|nr:cobalt-precorrin-5B (C(1))-methyltransferase CbiD [Duncaniella sp.]